MVHSPYSLPLKYVLQKAEETSLKGASLERNLHRLACLAGIATVLLLHAPALAQLSPAKIRITQPLNESRRVIVPGNVHPLAQAQFDQGRAPADLPLNRMLLLLKRTPEQEAALHKMLDALHDGASPLYHHWLAPDNFGQLFGPADADVRTVTNWLASHGFHDLHISPGRTSIEFSGTALQVERAFATPIHKYVVNRQEHWANAADPQIPEALTPVVAGVATLHNFFPTATAHLSKEKRSAQIDPLSPEHPLFTDASGHSLAPADLGLIYNVDPLYTAGIDGSGSAIAIVASSNIDLSDVQDFRRVFRLPVNDPQILLNGPDPGVVDGPDIEALLDAEWAGALAPRASVALVVSADTNSTFGFELSEQYIIDHNLAHIMSESFGACEAYFTASDIAGFVARAEQAAAQGITTVVASGDSGSAACDQIDGALLPSTAVSAPASTPYAVAVGGTQFSEGPNPSRYWNRTNSSTGESARSYIPEIVWNESCSSYTQCLGESALAGGGGPSILFSKPAWQSSVPGIPNDNARDVPDLALSASAYHDPYLLCAYGGCRPNPKGTIDFYTVGGTSAAAPLFAGIMALVDQKTQARQGLANIVLYRLAAAANLAACDASNAAVLPASSCVFHDVTSGDNAVPGEPGYGSSTGKFQAAVGYDLATGLGSVNAANLVNQWASIGFSATATTLFLSPTHFPHGTPVDLSIQVKGTANNATPTGLISLLTSLGESVGFYPLLNGQAIVNTTALPVGTYGLIAHYAGDAVFAPSDSAPVSLSVLFNPVPTTTTEQVFTVDDRDNLVLVSSVPYGSFLSFDAAVASVTPGVLTGAVNFIDNGAPLPGDPYPLTASRTTGTPNGLLTVNAGQHSVVARYSGDANFGSSTSAPVVFTVTRAPVTLNANANLSQLAPRSPVQFTVMVTQTGSGNLPTGSVSFRVGDLQLGTAPLGLPQPAGLVLPELSFSPPQPFVTATLTTSSLPSGFDLVVATYSGDANYLGSSATISVLVQSDVLHQDFPAVSIGSFQTTALSYHFDSALPTPSFSTRYGRDFTVTSVTCVPAGDGQNCNLAALFTPKFSGLRQDALIATVDTGASSRILAITSLSGIGEGPQAAVIPGVASVVAGGGTNKGVDGHGDGGPAMAATLSNPASLAVDPLGNLFIADTYAGLVQKVDHSTGILSVVAGSGAFANSGDGGPATQAGIGWPSAIAIDAAGDLYVASLISTTIRKIDAVTGIISTIPFDSSAANPPSGVFSNFSAISSLAFSRSGDLYIAMGPLSTVLKVSIATGVTTRFAGTGVPGSAGDGGPAAQAQLQTPSALALDSAGNLYIADSNPYAVRKVDALTGIITPIAATKSLAAPAGLAVDAGGDLYLSNARGISILKIDARGLTSTIFQTTSAAQSLVSVGALALQGDGSLYVSDPFKSVVWKIVADSAAVTSSAQLPALLSNIGTQPLTLTALTNTPDGAGSVVCSTQEPIAPGSSCAILGPLAPAPVTVTDNSLNQTATQQIDFNGVRSVRPSFDITSTAPDFGSQALFVPSRPATVTIVNTGTVAFTVSAAITGANSSDFTFSSDCPALLASGQRCTVLVTFTPKEAGFRTTELRVAINGAASPSQFSFSGVGGAPSGCTVYNFSASPLPLIAPSGVGSAIVHVSAGCAYDLRLGGPAGPLFASAANVSDSPTGAWVVDDATFYLQPSGDTSSSDTLGVLQIPVLPAACIVNSFTASPGTLTGNTAVSSTINADAGCAYDIRIGSPGGALFATGQGVNAFDTGAWVTNGMTFYLQLAHRTTASATLATVSVNVTPNGCRVDEFDATPNPVPSDSPGATIVVSANATCPYDIRIGSPAGTLLSSGNGATSTPVSGSLTGGTAFYLQLQNDQTATGTLAQFTVAFDPAACVIRNFSAISNPILSPSAFASTTITADADCAYDIRINAPSGPLLVSAQGASSTPTGNVVTDGTLFYLQPKGIATPDATLRKLRVAVVSDSTN